MYMERNYIKGTKFEGNEVSEYGLQNKRVDYATLDKAFDSVFSLFKIKPSFNPISVY